MFGYRNVFQCDRAASGSAAISLPRSLHAGESPGTQRLTRHGRGGETSNADAKKTTLRMIRYGINVLAADDGKGATEAPTGNTVM
jgi:hypothetical protein